MRANLEESSGKPFVGVLRAIVSLPERSRPAAVRERAYSPHGRPCVHHPPDLASCGYHGDHHLSGALDPVVEQGQLLRGLRQKISFGDGIAGAEASVEAAAGAFSAETVAQHRTDLGGGVLAQEPESNPSFVVLQSCEQLN